MRTFRIWLLDLLIGPSIGAVQMVAMIALLMHLTHDELDSSWWDIALFGTFAGAVGTLAVFLNRALRFVASRIKQALRRRISTRHARKSQGNTLPDGD